MEVLMALIGFQFQKGDRFGAMGPDRQPIYGIVIDEGGNSLMISGGGREGFSRVKGPVPDNALPVVGLDTNIPFEIRFALDAVLHVIG
jgi:hypothetical protein